MAPAVTPMNLNPSATAIGVVVCLAIAGILFIFEWLYTVLRRDKKGQR